MGQSGIECGIDIDPTSCPQNQKGNNLIHKLTAVYEMGLLSVEQVRSFYVAFPEL